MRLLTIVAAAAAVALAACTPPAETPETPPAPVAVNAPSGEYTLDPNHSTVTVRALHFALSHYTLRFNTVSGTLNFNAGDTAQSSVEATVAVTSLDTPYGGDRNFDAELQNSEWLNGAAHPTATFRSTAVEQTGPNTGRVTGDLTFNGQTHPITLDVTYNGAAPGAVLYQGRDAIGFSARATFSRSDFGLTRYASIVADEVELILEVEFTRRS
jgi:polyisoprenoid-binding protein YceI